MKNKLDSIRRKGPAQEFDPAIEAELEMDMESPEGEEDLGVEEESDMAEPMGGGAEQVIAMLADLSPEDLASVQEELDMLMAEAGGAESEDMEDVEYEDMPEEEVDEEEMA